MTQPSLFTQSGGMCEGKNGHQAKLSQADAGLSNMVGGLVQAQAGTQLGVWWGGTMEHVVVFIRRMHVSVLLLRLLLFFNNFGCKHA